MGRIYFSDDLDFLAWETVERELQKLLNFTIDSVSELVEFWKQTSELRMILVDAYEKSYITMTRFADKPEYAEAFHRFVSDIQAPCQPYEFRLKKKFCESLYFSELPDEYRRLGQILKNDIDLFHEKNVELSVEEEKLSAQYRERVANMTVFFRGEEKTVQQLAPFLEEKENCVREDAWRVMMERYARESESLDALFDTLKDIRIKMAKNAGFSNYRDYVHKQKGRFSYTPDNLLDLHKAVEETIVPLVLELDEERKEKLKLSTIRPWDFKVDIEGEFPKPFVTHEELVDKGVRTIGKVDPIFGAELLRMRERGYIDAENRKGKAPGGYCSPLYEEGSSFIFMHATGVRSNVQTLVHEAGHAMHNLMTKDQTILEYRGCPSEVAELASMSMELLSFEHWDEFYEKGLLHAILKDELKERISFLPWGVVVDAFQHWIYLNPEKTAKERGEYFSDLMDRFRIGGDWTGLEKEKAMRWMLQLHIFEHPFYYIEYVMAQLGAIAMYRNFCKDPRKTIEEYKNFLRVGDSKPVSEVYNIAGITFDFSVEYMRELMEFVRNKFV